MKDPRLISGYGVPVTDNQKAYQEIYSRPEPSWGDDWQMVLERVHEPKRQIVAEKILEAHHEVIADLGTGGGRILELLRIKGFNGALIGVDLHIPDKLKQRALDYDIKIIESDVLAFQLEGIDGLIDFSAWHYKNYSEIDTMLQKANRSTKCYIIEAFDKYEENMTLDANIKRRTDGRCGIFNEEALDSVFRKNGFKKALSHEFDKDEVGRIMTFNVYSRKPESTVTEH
jgi:hypothetical protein